MALTVVDFLNGKAFIVILPVVTPVSIVSSVLIVCGSIFLRWKLWEKMLFNFSVGVGVLAFLHGGAPEYFKGIITSTSMTPDEINRATHNLSLFVFSLYIMLAAAVIGIIVSFSSRNKK